LEETMKKFSYDIELESDSIFQWNIAIHGPNSTPYFGGTFLARLSFPTDYPLTSPSISFRTKIFHPNVNVDGKVCIGMLAQGWKINTSAIAIIEALVELLKHPDIENPLYPEIANLKSRDEEQFNKIAVEWTLKYAM